MMRALLVLVFLAGCVRNTTTGRPQMITLDEPTELALGIQAYQEALARSVVSENPQETEPLARVGKRIAQAAGKLGWRWEYQVVVDDEALLAWCLPGGKIALSTGFFPVLKDEAGLAFLIGHAVAHALQRHGSERVSERFEREDIAQFTLAPLGGKDPAKARVLRSCYGIEVDPSMLFDPHHEAEADRLALDLAARAGYDPKETLEAWARLQKTPASGFLTLHPCTAVRAKDLESRRAAATALFEQTGKAPVGPLPAINGRKGRGDHSGAPSAPAGQIVASPAGSLRTLNREGRPALLLEFWINADVFLETVRITGPEGISLPIEAMAGIPANAKKQAFAIRPDGGSASFAGGRYAMTLSGTASGRTFAAACEFDVR